MKRELKFQLPFFIGAAKGSNTPRLALKFNIRFQTIPYGLAQKWFTRIC
jgi:hypothetical protein